MPLRSQPFRVAFMGTPDFAVPALRALADHGRDHGYEIACVYTQPPRPKGRGQQVQKSPVHLLAEQYDIPVRTPGSLKKDQKAQEDFIALGLDAAVVAAYGLILPVSVLEAPVYGCFNIHASLLPRWRGASPIQHAIWKGDRQSGITIMKMEQGLDTGPMIAKRAVTIRSQTTAQSLHDELAALGGPMTAQILDRLAAGDKIEYEPQNDQDATYAPLLTKEDGRIDWTQDAAQIDRQIRALNPWPGVWTNTAQGKRVKIHEAEPVSESFTAPPGTLIDRAGHVSCGGDTGLRLINIQPENARAMDIPSAINGHYIQTGSMLG